MDGSATSALLTALGLSGASGLNPWLPLFLAAALERLGWITLDPTWAGLGDTPVLIALGVVTALDFVGDKVPLLDHALHVAGLAVAPVTGTLLFDAEAGAHVPLAVSVLAGGGSAGALHVARAAMRPAVSGATGGIGAPVASLMEDVAALLLAVVAFLIPAVAALTVAALLVGGVLAIRSSRRWLGSRPAR